MLVALSVAALFAAVLFVTGNQIPFLDESNLSSHQLANEGEGYPVAASRPQYLLSADDFYIQFEDGRRFNLDPASATGVSSGGDPGDESYHSIEWEWYQQPDVEMRWFAYLHSDGAEWWSDEMRIYDGHSPGEWEYLYGDFFRMPLGEAFQSKHLELRFVSQGRPDGIEAAPGTIVFENLRVEAFLQSAGAGGPRVLWLDELNYGSLAAAEAAGWQFTKPQYVEATGSSLRVANTGSDNGAALYRISADYDGWSFIGRLRAASGSYASPYIYGYVDTPDGEKRFALKGDGYANQYRFEVGETTEKFIDGYQPEFGTWLTFRLDVRGGTMTFSVDGKTIHTEETGWAYVHFRGAMPVAGWTTTVEHDRLCVMRSTAGASC